MPHCESELKTGSKCALRSNERCPSDVRAHEPGLISAAQTRSNGNGRFRVLDRNKVKHLGLRARGQKKVSGRTAGEAATPGKRFVGKLWRRGRKGGVPINRCSKYVQSHHSAWHFVLCTCVRVYLKRMPPETDEPPEDATPNYTIIQSETFLASNQASHSQPIVVEPYTTPPSLFC